jgi:hypothetical protein
MPRCNKLKTKLTQNQFYCVKCCKRISALTDNICVTEYKNKKATGGYTPALRSYCITCDTPLTKWIKHKDVDRLIDKYGNC